MLRRAWPLLLVLVPFVSCEGEITERPVSFREDIAPVFQANCMPCHWSTLITGAEVFDVTDPAQLVNKPSRKTQRPFVVPGKPDESYLMRKLTATELVAGEEGSPMPFSFPRLDETQLANLRRWIEQGARSDDPLFDPRYDPARGYDGGTVSGDAPYDRNSVMYIFGIAIGGRRMGLCSQCHSANTPYPPNLAAPFEPDGGAIGYRSANGQLIIVPGDPDNSPLYQRLLAPVPGGVGRGMPLQLRQLDEQQLTLVRRWILEGAKDN